MASRNELGQACHVEIHQTWAAVKVATGNQVREGRGIGF